MPDLDNEEQLGKIIKGSCEPVTPSPELQSRLHKLLLSEASRHRVQAPRRLWTNPLVWASVVAALVLLIISLTLWGQPDRIPVVMPEPSTSPILTPAPSANPSSEPTLAPSTTPSAEPSAEPSPTPSETPPALASAGTLEIRVTDDPPERDVSSILVMLSDIQVHKESEEPDGEGEWITVIEEPVSFDLIYLKERGVEEILGDTEIGIGHYTQIRMDVTLEEAIIDGETVTEGIVFPSEVLKIAGSFDIEEGKTTTLIFDFDAEKSLVFTGEGKVMFKPVVKLTVTGPE